MQDNQNEITSNDKAQALKIVREKYHTPSFLNKQPNKNEILTAYATSLKEIDGLNKALEASDSQKLDLMRKSSDLESQLNENSLKNQELNQEIHILNKSIFSLKQDYDLALQDIESLNETLDGLCIDHSSLKEKYAVLETKLNTLKSPVDFEVLRNIIGDSADSTYKEIKQELIEHTAKYSSRNGDIQEVIKKVKNLGYSNKHNMLPVDVKIKAQSHGDEDALINTVFDFDEPEAYMNEYERAGFAEITFKTKENNSFKDKSIIVTYFCDNLSDFSNKLIDDASDFAKAALWGRVIPLFDDGHYTEGFNIVKNNGLHELAMTYVSRNQDNNSLVVNSKPVFDDYFTSK
ncbi:MAG: hypothetical protein ACLFN8_04795 [Candidatus Woesearchaeota archaeon]